MRPLSVKELALSMFGPSLGSRPFFCDVSMPSPVLLVQVWPSPDEAEVPRYHSRQGCGVGTLHQHDEDRGIFGGRALLNCPAWLEAAPSHLQHGHRCLRPHLGEPLQF